MNGSMDGSMNGSMGVCREYKWSVGGSLGETVEGSNTSFVGFVGLFLTLYSSVGSSLLKDVFSALMVASSCLPS